MSDFDVHPGDPDPRRDSFLSPAGWWADLGFMLSHLTRLPAPDNAHAEFPGRLTRAARANPLVGIIVGVIGGAAYAIAAWLGLPPLVAATIAVVATILATGAYHEDGLADTCDGFGGAFEREKKLAIMHDSRHGSFGVIAIVASLLLRVGAIAAIAEPGAVFAALIAAHAVARAFLPAAMLWGTTARTDGQGFQAGKPDPVATWTALAIAGVVALIALGFAAIPALIASALAAVAMMALARRQIGGYTGDVLGATEQFAEIALLLTLAAIA